MLQLQLNLKSRHDLKSRLIISKGNLCIIVQISFVPITTEQISLTHWGGSDHYECHMSEKSNNLVHVISFKHSFQSSTFL